MAENLQKARRVFLQALLARPCLEETQLDQLVKDVNQHVYGDPLGNTRAQLLEGVNKALDPLQLHFTDRVFEGDGKRYFALVNLRNDTHSQLASPLTAAEVELFRQLLEKLVSLAPKATMREMDAIELMRGKGSSVAQAQALLDRLVRDRWLEQPPIPARAGKRNTGAISLGPRGQMELWRYLEEAFPEQVQQCNVCMEPILRGEACPNERCKTRLHFHCAAHWFNGREPKCPACKQEWHGRGREAAAAAASESDEGGDAPLRPPSAPMEA